MHSCADHLLKDIEKRSAVISQLQAQGSSDVISSVELVVLEQELAQGYYKATENMEASKFEEAGTHCTQALHLYCKVEVSYGTLH